MAYRSLAKSYAQRPTRPEAAERLLERMVQEELPPDITIFSDVLTSIAKANERRPAALRRLLKCMLDTRVTVPAEAGPSKNIYVRYLHAYAKAQGGDKAKTVDDVLLQMRGSGMHPDLDTCNAAVMVLAHARPALPADAERIALAFLASGTEDDDEAQDIPRATASTFTLLATAYARSRPSQPQEAEYILTRMEEAGFPRDTATLNAVLSAYSTSRPSRPDDINRILTEMEESTWGENAKPTTASYNALIHAYANTEPSPLPANAEQVLERMETASGLPADVLCYTSVVDAFAKAKDFEGAWRSYQLISEAGLKPGTVAHGAVLNAAKNVAGRTEEGRQAVDVATGLFNRLAPEERNTFLYCAIIGMLGKAGRADEAEVCFEEAASILKPWPSAFVYEAAYHATMASFSKLLAFRWLRESNKKVAFSVETGGRPWMPRKRSTRVYSH